MNEGNKSSFQERLLHFGINNILFTVLYIFSNYYASTVEVVNSIYLPWEQSIPFIEWTIIPYFTSCIFFSLQFLIENNREKLYLLSKRVAFVTIMSTTVFIFFPLANSFTVPEKYFNNFKILFDLLYLMDKPFNQCPSLHVSYILCAWFVIKDKIAGVKRVLVVIWFIMICFSTLTIFQHHSIDILGSLILMSITIFIFPGNRWGLKNRGLQIASVYFLLAVSLFTIMLFTSQWYLLYLSISFYSVAVVYYTNNVNFIRKEKGVSSLLYKILFAPYLFGYWFMWAIYKSKKPYGEVLPNFYFGRRLTDKESQKLQEVSNVYVVDLSAELLENKYLSKNNYFSHPLLDITIASTNNLETTYLTIEKIMGAKNPEDKVYIHCTMGYSRSAIIVYLYLTKSLGHSKEYALDKIKKARPEVIFPSYILEKEYILQQ